MTKSRLEAFSDGVIAILITIMVLELRIPSGTTAGALRPVIPTLLTYILSFIFLGIYWNNHHHMFTVVRRINGSILWANLHLLFWLSLVPVTTSWMGRSGTAPFPTICYGVVLFFAAVSYTLLQQCIIAVEGPDSTLARAVQADVKGKASLACYVAAIPLALVSTWIAWALFVAVALLWLAPDRRIEAILDTPHAGAD